MKEENKNQLKSRFCACDLRVNSLSNYCWIGSDTPHFSWKMLAGPGTMQSAYRIQAASSPELFDSPDLWDSDWVESEQSIGIPWGGTVLKSRQKVCWRVILRDKDGNYSVPSEIAVFEIALLRNRDWKARWIHLAGANPSCSSPCPYFRRDFNLNTNPVRAVLYITARGLFDARLNGKRVGNDHFVPGWTDFRQEVQYLSYDVTSLLKRGKNAAGVILGDGWLRLSERRKPQHLRGIPRIAIST